MKELKVALRGLVRNPGYTFVAVLTLVIGIGCNSAVFGLLDAVYFRPIPIREPQDLVRISLQSPKSTFGLLSYSEYENIRKSVSGFRDVVAIGRRGVTFRQPESVRLMIIHYVSGNYFSALGIPMNSGRGLSPEDDSSSPTNPTVVINHHVWQDSLGGRPDVIGSTIQLNDTIFTVVGVTAPGFPGLSRSQRTDVWVPVAQARFVVPGLREEVAAPYQRWFDVLALVEPDAAQTIVPQLGTLVANWYTENAEQYNNAVLSSRHYLDDERSQRSEGAVFLGLVVLVLILAAANVANLTLARNEARRREMSIRLALGGSSRRLLIHSASESVVLCLAGALLGLLLAAWLVEFFQLLIPPGGYSAILDVRMDARFLLFTGILAAVSMVLVGVLPAWRHVRSSVATGLTEEGMSATASGRRLSTRDFLIMTQVAISVVVLISAGLLVRSFLYGLHSNPGFDTGKNVATFYLVPGLNGYDAEGTHRFFEQARQSVAASPGVKQTSYAIRLPAQGNEAGWAADFTIPGEEPPPGESYFRIKYTMVGPNYFDVMGTRILKGRGITETDAPNSAGIAVVNEYMAERFWPNEDPIGKVIVMGRQRPAPRTIVGVAENNKVADLYEENQMYVYVPFAQDRRSFGLLLVESETDTQAILAAVRRELANIDRTLPVLNTGSFASHLNLVLFEQRRDAWVAAGISLLALFLGIIGVYGVVSLVTKRRTREIGIRMALGAARSEVLRLILVRVLKLTAAGVITGAICGLGAGRLLAARLHGVTPGDPVNIVTAAVVLLAAAVLAALLPSLRAAHLDPTQVLRQE